MIYVSVFFTAAVRSGMLWAATGADTCLILHGRGLNPPNLQRGVPQGRGEEGRQGDAQAISLRRSGRKFVQKD